MHQFLTPIQQMSQTLLMPGFVKEIVATPAIVNHRAVPISPKYLLRYLMTTTGTNDIKGGIFCDKSPKPLVVAADFPGGL